MELTELENKLLELQNLKNKAVKELNYEVAAGTRDKIKALILLFTETTKGFDENELLAAEKVLAKWK